MSCGCTSGRTAPKHPLHQIRQMARQEAREEQRDYLIYKLEGNIYYDGKSCWEKAGRQGTVIEFIPYL